MNSRFLVVETSLNRAEFRWKGLKFLQYSAVLGTVLSLGVLFFGGAILLGWVVDKAIAFTVLAVLGAVGFIAWAVMVVSVMAGAPNRTWLAAAVERVDRRLLDRLNTLLFLEKSRGEARAESFALRIAKQTNRVVSETPPPAPFSSTRALVHVLALILTLTLTVLLYELYRPWNQLQVNHTAPPQRAVASTRPPDLNLPPTNNIEANKTWGEVRITDPGADLKVTKVDVVPLQIEAAANQPLRNVGWYSAINGSQESAHPLPRPSEPRYAVYQPTIYLDELQLSDWDVVTYYASASTEKSNSYGSEVYFLEVRPFREDIAKMPGGEAGQAHQCLNEISILINRQQHVIRQTYQHLQKPPEQENLRTQDRNKLADAETDLGDSAQHLYAKMAAEMENKPIGQALDSLAKAEKSLSDASTNLHKNIMPQAQNDERQALSDLVAMRKMFQKAVTDNPAAFQEDQAEQETPPVADATKKLNQMAEFRNEAKAAKDFVSQTLEKQKRLEGQAKSGPRSDYPRLADEEQQLQQSLESFQNQHPQSFTNVQAESRQAREAMSTASDSLQNHKSNASSDMQNASRALQNFSNAMQARSAAQQLADAYKLKQMLDQQIQKLDQSAKPDSKVSGDDLQKTARDADQTIDQLARTAEQEPTRDAFGQPLRDALSGQNKVNLETKLKQLQMAEDAAARQQRAGEASQALANVSKAFEQSQPKALQAARGNDSLKPNEQDSFAQGMAQLNSLLRQLQDNRDVSREDQAKQGREALLNLQSGMRAQHGDNQKGNQLLLQLEQLLKPEAPLEVADLKKLMDQLQHFSVETSDQLAKQDDPPELSNIDPSHLPPAYRGRIQKYFQKLSEK